MIVKKIVTASLGGGALIAAAAAISLPMSQQSVEAAVPIPAPRTNVIVTEEDQVAVFRRRMLLGYGRRIPACSRCSQRALWLCRRQRRNRNL